jgi:hypothetical protein
VNITTGVGRVNGQVGIVAWCAPVGVPIVIPASWGK